MSHMRRGVSRRRRGGRRFGLGRFPLSFVEVFRTKQIEGSADGLERLVSFSGDVVSVFFQVGEHRFVVHADGSLGIFFRGGKGLGGRGGRNLRGLCQYGWRGVVGSRSGRRYGAICLERSSARV